LVGSIAARSINARNRASLYGHGTYSPTPALAPGPAASSTAASGDAALALSASPNPFRDRADVSFSLPEAGPARLAVYDALGREVAVLTDATVDAGTHRATFDASALPAGVYVLRLATPAGVETRRITSVR
ncbi:MAG: T9SS type A sorting domain-containing protein, partial [Bacteroidota bacterium]